MHKFWKSNIFSQWGMTPITILGVTYNCAEQVMMAGKAALFCEDNVSNEKIIEKIMAAIYPVEHQRLGRLVAGYSDDKWYDISDDIVYAANWYKFNQNEHCFSKLMSMDVELFVEASPIDRIWGIGLAQEDVGSNHKSTWRGQNRLGQVITDVRDDIRSGVPNQARLDRALAVLALVGKVTNLDILV